MGESRNVYRVLVRRPEGKKPLGRPRRRWEDNMKMDLREVGYDDRDWSNLAQDREQWRAAMNRRMPYKFSTAEYADIVYVYGLCDGSSLVPSLNRRFPNKKSKKRSSVGNCGSRKNDAETNQKEEKGIEWVTAYCLLKDVLEGMVNGRSSWQKKISDDRRH
ncbi:hypothetical protein ANN_17833 [Periplaneta americana]|uniref:Uncharacterized protein n=1 Tax=Periplaneta americana TaxID=6978 RepID=A0ABQ8SV08_PERAM|nr:hypothetical protein ANN_17833 [Periplaneta americana]